MSLHYIWLLNILKVLCGRSYWTAMICSKIKYGSFIYGFTVVSRLSHTYHVYSTAETCGIGACAHIHAHRVHASEHGQSPKYSVPGIHYKTSRLHINWLTFYVFLICALLVQFAEMILHMHPWWWSHEGLKHVGLINKILQYRISENNRMRFVGLNIVWRNALLCVVMRHI
jgi:hypothetical protein